jgi:hypothetical protein
MRVCGTGQFDLAAFYITHDTKKACAVFTAAA